jgi:hypothetical protein
MALRWAMRMTRGQRKIEIRLIESEVGRQVCFSKRHVGLFNMLSELPTMCGAEVAAVTFSLGGKPFSLGHPLSSLSSTTSTPLTDITHLDGCWWWFLPAWCRQE